MARLYYFLALDRATAEEIKEMLPGRFEGAIQQRKVLRNGPNGGAGICVVGGSEGDPPAVNNETQEWHKHHIDDIWFGWEKDRPPTPADLQRKEMLPGYEIERNGHRWMIPKALVMTEVDEEVEPVCVLPRKLRWNGGAFEHGDIMEKHKRLFELGKIAYDFIAKQWEPVDDEDEGSSKTQTFTIPDEIYNVAGELFTVNYRIGMDEVAALGLLVESGEVVLEVVRLVVDGPGLLELLQKKTVGTD